MPPWPAGSARPYARLEATTGHPSLVSDENRNAAPSAYAIPAVGQFGFEDFSHFGLRALALFIVYSAPTWEEGYPLAIAGVKRYTSHSPMTLIPAKLPRRSPSHWRARSTRSISPGRTPQRYGVRSGRMSKLAAELGAQQGLLEPGRQQPAETAEPDPRATTGQRSEPGSRPTASRLRLGDGSRMTSSSAGERWEASS
jgi:hypothetical protein